MNAVLEARAIGKRYGTLTALQGIDLQLRMGEIHGLIGPNGSGKSTLLKCLAGAEIVTSGSVHFAGRNVTHDTPAQRVQAGMSMKFQITAVLPDLTVYDNLLLAFQAGERRWRLAFSRTRAALDESITKLLTHFNLDARWNDPASSLPHGQAQWLEICMALARKPTVLLLDEPTAGMSPHRLLWRGLGL